MTELVKLFDAYGRQARLYPALIAILPVVAIVLMLFPSLMTGSMGAALVGLAATCGLVYFLADFARGRGKQVETKLLRDWGGWPTTEWLRHRSTRLSATTKARYHTFLNASVAGVGLPDSATEAADPPSADMAYASAVEWLKEQCRNGSAPLVEKENANYGFRRNLLGLKPFGIVCSIVAITAMLILIARAARVAGSPWQDVAVKMVRIVTPLQLVVLASLLGFLAVWIWVVNPSWVRSAADDYARALLATCDQPKSNKPAP